MNVWTGRGIVFLLALILGTAFAKLHIPIPYVLGGMFIAMGSKVFFEKYGITWSKNLRELALLVIGYGIGKNFSITAWNYLLGQTAGVLGSTTISIGFCLFLSYVIAKITKTDLQSCCIGFLPGGMTAAMLMCDDDETIDPNVVMVMQTIRLFAVVICIPFLVLYMVNGNVQNTDLLMPKSEGFHWLIFLPLSLTGAFLAKKVHLPTPVLLGPILVTAAFALLVGPVQPVVPYLMAPAQVSIGLFMGMMMDPVRIMKIKNIFFFTVISSLLLLLVSYLVAVVLANWYGFTVATGFLAMAPGGIAEMSLAGMSMGEDVSIILSYQLIRLIIMNAIVPGLLAWFFRRRRQIKQAS